MCHSQPGFCTVLVSSGTQDPTFGQFVCEESHAANIRVPVRNIGTSWNERSMWRTVRVVHLFPNYLCITLVLNTESCICYNWEFLCSCGKGMSVRTIATEGADLMWCQPKSLLAWCVSEDDTQQCANFWQTSGVAHTPAPCNHCQSPIFLHRNFDALLSACTDSVPRLTEGIEHRSPIPELTNSESCTQR